MAAGLGSCVLGLELRVGFSCSISILRRAVNFRHPLDGQYFARKLVMASFCTGAFVRNFASPAIARSLWRPRGARACFDRAAASLAFFGAFGLPIAFHRVSTRLIAAHRILAAAARWVRSARQGFCSARWVRSAPQRLWWGRWVRSSFCPSLFRFVLRRLAPR
jgi:hypothetical protein